MKLVQRLHFALTPVVVALVISAGVIVYLWQVSEYRTLERERWLNRLSSALIAAEYESRAMGFLSGELAGSEQFVRHLQDTGDYSVRNFLDAHIAHLMSEKRTEQMGAVHLFVIDDLFTITAANGASDPFSARELPSDIYQLVFDTHILVTLGEPFTRKREVYIAANGELRAMDISAHDPVHGLGEKRSLTRKNRSLMVIDAPLLQINKLIETVSQFPDVSLSFGSTKVYEPEVSNTQIENAFIDGEVFQVNGFGISLELTILDSYYSPFKRELLAQTLGYVAVIIVTLLSIVHIVVRLNVTGPIQGLLTDIQRGGLELRYFKRSKGNSEVAVLRNAYIDSLTKVKFEAEFDNLTKLANRKSFIEYVDQRVASYANDSSYLIAWDIVNFRRINDIHGQDYADQLLVRLSEQLLLLTNHNQNKMGGGCSDYSMSRYASNTFCAVLTSPDLDNAKALATLFRSRFFQAFQSSGFASHIEVAMAVIPLTNNQHVKMWQKGVEEALSKAKQITNGLPISVFDDDLLSDLSRKEDIEKQLLSCIKDGAFELNYMPLVDATTLQVASIECLIRCLVLRDKGVGPDEFIPIAEQANVIIEIDKWVLDNALFDLAKMTKECGYTGCVSINVSALELYNDSFIEHLCSVCSSHGVEYHRVILEITETSYVKSTQETITMIGSLRDLGFRISVDDFGTGFTSINQLLHYPVDELKIDKSFVDLILLQGDEKKMLKSIIALGHSCGAKVVGEGVETEQQHEYLNSLGCDYLQGYYISKPLTYTGFCNLYNGLISRSGNVTKLIVRNDS